MHAGSMLLGAIVRACLAIGYTRIVSYTREDEAGTVYRAANWRPVSRTPARDWCKLRHAHKGLLPGIYEPATEVVARVRWETGPGALAEDPALAGLGRRAPKDGVSHV